MDPELSWLAYTLAVTALFPFPYVLNRIAVQGVTATLGNPPASGDTALAPWAQRARRAHANAVENLVLTGCLLLAVVVTAGCANAPLTSATDPAQECHPGFQADKPQFIVGYGSLMQDESRKRTAPQAGPAHPVEISGFRRGWFAAGASTGVTTTFLGVVTDPAAHFNAVVYRVEKAEVLATDGRETGYCRRPVAPSQIKLLDPSAVVPLDRQAWIYVNTAASTASPTRDKPIVQSYVDIFVSGCLEQEERFRLRGFAAECLATTSGWSAHWVNDRLYPRRPFIHQPRAGQIDRLLSEQVGNTFSKVKIE